eukprot:2327136-Rhodomonas_salina.1
MSQFLVALLQATAMLLVLFCGPCVDNYPTRPTSANTTVRTTASTATSAIPSTSISGSTKPCSICTGVQCVSVDEYVCSGIFGKDFGHLTVEPDPQ